MLILDVSDVGDHNSKCYVCDIMVTDKESVIVTIIHLLEFM